MEQTTRKILIVEDNNDWRHALALFLKRGGYEPLEAPTGAEAIEQALGVHPDLILMDLGLPGMTGDEVTASLKANSQTRDIPVIVQTAFSSDLHTSRALAAGAAEVLYKPLKLTTLRHVLQKYFPGDTGEYEQSAD
jgi:CheY-like chemotaxis protein